MKTLAELMSVYQRYHTKEVTKLTHFIGVPSIIFALQLLLSWPQVSFLGSSISFAWLALFALLIYYFILDPGLAFITALFLIPLTYLAQVCIEASLLFATLLFFLTFIGGWVAQLLGHHYEGKKPAFMDNFSQVFVAPIFLAAELVFVIGYRKALQKKVLSLSAGKTSR